MLGTLPVEGEAEDAGFYQIDAITHTYVGNIDFMTEPMNIGGFDVPSMPVQIPSEGTWAFANDDTELHFTSTEGVLQVYEVENLTADFALLRGYVTFPFDFPGIGAMDLDIELELQLEK